jgi:hypothetical protein
MVGVAIGEDDEDGLSEGEVVGWGGGGGWPVVTTLVVVAVVVIVN